jgi:hypothetical protein
LYNVTSMLMSRLYQEREFRDLQPRQFLEKIVKIIPSEVIAGFMFFTGVLPLIGPDWKKPLIWIVFSALIIAIPLYYRSISNGVPYLKHSAVSVIAFFIWSYSISGVILVGDEFHNPVVGSLALMLFTLLSPYVRLDR